MTAVLLKRLLKKPNHKKKRLMGRLTPPQLLIIGFLCAILLGSVLLSLPAATQGSDRLSLVDSLFTATSATCVTGLIVKDTGTFFTPFGRWTIFVLFQAGGLGIMTFSTLFAVILGRKLGFQQSDVIRSTLDGRNIVGFKKLLFYIIGITIVTELVGSLCLFFRWRLTTDWTVLATIEQAVFHSVSAFCNAGFSLFNNSLESFRADPVINLTMMGLIFIGGIGFVVIMDVLRLFVKKKQERKISLQSKIVLTVSIGLILVGALLLFFLEEGRLMKGMSLSEKIFGSLFQSVTARTAGFNTLPIGNLSIPSVFILIVLMFIGASPGSTGGGIKTCTLAVLVSVVFCNLKNNKRVKLFGRSMTKQVIRETIVIVFLSALWVLVFTLLVTVFSNAGSINQGSFLKHFFEVVSAFGTVGLSTGITSELNTASKVCIILTMFAGRVGPLTLALAIAFRERKDKFIYPEESIMVG